MNLVYHTFCQSVPAVFNNNLWQKSMFNRTWSSSTKQTAGLTIKNTTYELYMRSDKWNDVTEDFPSSTMKR